MKRINTMSTLLVMLIFSVAAVAVAVDAAPFEFKVGDDIGWRVPPANHSEFYSYWASLNRFRIGDFLSFEYKNDSVLMVEKWDYYHCNSSNPILAFNNGKALIKLDRPGSFFFISGFPDHCKHGQRLLVQVMSPHDHIVSPPSLSPDSYNYPTDAAPSPYSRNTAASESVPGTVVVLLITAALGLILISF